MNHRYSDGDFSVRGQAPSGPTKGGNESKRGKNGTGRAGVYGSGVGKEWEGSGVRNNKESMTFL